MDKKTVKIAKIVVCAFVASATMQLDALTGQAELEEILCNGFDPQDYFPNGMPPYVPNRYRNSLPDFQRFIGRNGWTTNQLIEGMICAITNNVSDENWVDASKRDTAEVAAWKLGEIDNPAVTNFFRQFNDSDDTDRLKIETIPPMFWRTNLEPEVLAYMRTLCVRTNVYCKVECNVMLDMFETLSTMPNELKPAATNRVAKYMYFAIRHTTKDVTWQDRELANFIPAYSNSIQRLSAMQYVASTIANPRTRALAQQQVDRLSAIPTNQLNDVNWIAE